MSELSHEELLARISTEYYLENRSKVEIGATSEISRFQVARLLTNRVRSDDLVARLGGDELGVLMPGADVDRAAELAERLRAEMAGLVPEGFVPGELSLSLGVAAVSGDEAYPMELVSRADAQLYRAKITRNAVGAPQGPVGAAAG